MFAFGRSSNFPPSGFLPCDGRLLSVQNNAALFSLIGNTYGGDGVNNFALPDYRGLFPIGAGTNANNTFHTNLGQKGGSFSASVPTINISLGPGSNAIGVPTPGQPITTTPPYLAINFAICVEGYYPVSDY